MSNVNGSRFTINSDVNQNVSWKPQNLGPEIIIRFEMSLVSRQYYSKCACLLSMELVDWNYQSIGFELYCMIWNTDMFHKFQSTWA